MKKLTILLGVFFGLAAGSVYASDADMLKRIDVRACEAKTQMQGDAEGQQKKQTRCECEIENTDYEALSQAKQKGDLAKIQEIDKKAKEACKSSE